jgi:cytochrome c-type biogenesis protein
VDEWIQAFLLGNGAILGNVCVLPLYPALIAFLGGSTTPDRGRRGTAFLGFVVFAGVMSVMLVLGWILYEINRSFSSIFDWFLPLVYGAVILLGFLMLLGRNPFMWVGGIRTPILGNRLVTAFMYGVLIGPMTLPCTGPLVISTFVLGVGDFGSLADGIAYFLAYGLGFGWPLIVLPMLAASVQRQLTRWLARHAVGIARLSGALLIGVAISGFWIDVLPSLE